MRHAALLPEVHAFQIDVVGASGSGKIDPIKHGDQIDWNRLRDAWLHVAQGNVEYLVLDGDDEERRRRIEARPGWRGRDANAQIVRAVA